MMRSSVALLCVLLQACAAMRQGITVHEVEQMQGASTEEQADEGAVTCASGATEQLGCVSVCRWLNLTNWTAPNGQCENFVDLLVESNYTRPAFWKVFRKKSSLEPILKVLSTNCLDSEKDFYIIALMQLVEQLPEEKKAKYTAPLTLLEKQAAEVVAADVIAAASTEEDPENEMDSSELPECAANMAIKAGDIVTMELGGPNMSNVSASLSKKAAEDEALQLQQHFEYKRHFSYNATYNTSTNATWEERDFKSKTKRFFELAWKHTANTVIRVGKGVADLGINFGKGVADITMNAGRMMGKFFVWSGSIVTKTYAKQRQTTSRTGATLWTHSELGVGDNTLMSAYSGLGVGKSDICESGTVHMVTGNGRVIISRFEGDGTVDKEAYRAQAAERARLWEPYLSHYADTVSEWHRVVVGKCLSVFGTPGSSEYFEAVDNTTVDAMWSYEASVNETEEAFYQGIIDSLRTHDRSGQRVKPKAMFCSKFVAAVWSSTIGNPTDDPSEAPRKRDLKEMMPFNPGACSPWTIAQWLLSKKGSKSWSSCVADPATWNPCG
mmetsp:Transcript_16492/g.38034  ORF Transcript_16492/g.38034 Transcript_16492/m.38034 type:complete len:554 (+) Transcript_16492:72-1733(+)